MDEAILDSDMLSEVIKGKDAVVARHAGEYLSVHARFAAIAWALRNRVS